MQSVIQAMPHITSVLRRHFKDKKRGSFVLAAAALVLLRIWRRWSTRPRGAPFAPGTGVFGILLKFIQSAAQCKHLDYFHALHDLLGQTFVARIPFQPWWLVTTNPKNVEHVLKTNFENYHKGKLFGDRLAELLGHGIFNVDGQEWHKQRKTASRMFTASLFKEHIWGVVHRNARKLRNILEATDPDKPVDIFNLMNRFTLDTIGEIGFGKCIGSLEDPSSPFLKSFDRAQQISFQRFFVPFWQPQRWLEIGVEKESRIHFDRLDEYSRKVVRELQGNVERDSGKSNGVAWGDIESRKSFVGLFLVDAEKRGETLDEDFLRDLVLNFLIAGRDTTAQALSWTIYCLCINPAVEKKVRKEICDICGVRGPTYEDMNSLPYLSAVLSEALRLYPSVPMDIKQAMQDDTLPDGTFVPRGTAVCYNIYSMGRDRSIWGEDAEVFRPERWLEMKTPPDNYQYPVFNAGPRECLGRRLAQVEMKTCLAMLLPQLNFTLAVPKEQVTIDKQLTIGMGQGLPCYVSYVSNARLFSKSSTYDGESPTSAASHSSMFTCDTAVQASHDARAYSDDVVLHDAASDGTAEDIA